MAGKICNGRGRLLEDYEPLINQSERANYRSHIIMENTPLVKFIRNYIRDRGGVFSISSLVRNSMTSFPACVRCLCELPNVQRRLKRYGEREVFFLIEIKSFREEQKSVNSKKESL